MEDTLRIEGIGASENGSGRIMQRQSQLPARTGATVSTIVSVGGEL